MRIEHLMFERYGLFADRKLSFHPDAALHIVLGANEAGKTSALSGIGDLLFGFGGRTDYDFRHESKNLRIAGAFMHSDGRSFSARRRKGNKNTLIDANDQPVPDDTLAALLDGLTRDQFNREFGLTARALREGGEELLSAGGRLAETLAASSAGMTALSRVKDRLQTEADELFTKTRSIKREFYIAADRRDAADRKLRDAIVSREALSQLEKDLADARAKREALTAAHARSAATLARLQRTQRVRSHLAKLDTIQTELTALDALPVVSAQTLSEWRNAHDADAMLTRDLADLDAAAAADAAEIVALAVDDRLLAEGAAIDALRERLGAVRKAIDDLPRRRQARDAAEADLSEAARKLGLASHEILLAKLPTDPALAQARDLIAQIRQAEQAIAAAKSRHLRAQQEHDDFAAEDRNGAAVVDVAQLRQQFDSLGDIPAQADRLRRERSALGIETQTLTAMLASLQPSPGALDDLCSRPLPERAAIERYANAGDKAEAELQRLGDLIATLDASIAATQAELTRLSSAGAVPTRSDLMAARRTRDTQFDGLRAVLDTDRALRNTRLSEVMTSVRIIDGITDQLLTDTERAALYDEAQRRLADHRATRDSDAARLAKIENVLAEFHARWQQEWTASGLVPRNPADMLRWRDRIDEVLARLGKRDAHEAEIGALTSGLADGKSALVVFLHSVGRVVDSDLPADHLYREAKARLDALQTAWADAKARAVSKQRIARDLTEAVAARAAGETDLAAQRQIWPDAMAAIGQPAKATPAQAEAALSVWKDVLLPKATRDGESHRVTTIESDLAAFDRDVFDIIDHVAPLLKSESAQESLARLAAKLAEARSASDTSRRLQEGVAKRAVSKKAILARQIAHAAILADARRSLDLPDEALLTEPLEQIATRLRLDSDRAGLQRELHDIGDGKDESALRQERDGIDLDLLPGEIDREKIDQLQILNDIAEASALQHQKQRDLDDLMKGRDAAAAAAERAEASAELLSIAERWLLRSAAVRLATRAIEKHRAMVQDPLIARASALFATATGDAFMGLGIDYGDDSGPVLVARRNSDERVPVAGLSEGTRDQLFLALRLALLERRTTEPMPFIGDDLLASFDETRTLATLRLLAAAGAQRQVILFTHHRHVVDLAKSVPSPIVDVIEL